ncbi:MAG TPA: SSI family serine proteinase inhibitor [Streptosporangiaceae bacterium]|nr:SSI family serine proteinase inhibitor [Streptosporangiaceae bacterium]
MTGLIVATAMLAACGTATAPGSGAGSKSAPKPSKVDLSVRIIHGKGSGPTHWTLHCQPAGGTAPDAVAACKAILGVKHPFAPVSKVKVCPMILASAEQIVITGTWFGHKVDRVIVDGECDIGLFNNLHKTFY